VAQGYGPLLQFKVAQILQNDVWHRHAKCRGKILLCHRLLLDWISQESNETGRQILRAARFVELNRHSFAVSHLPKIFQIRGHDRNSVGTSQMGHSAATCG
jgi:hypothetical protein